MKTIYYAIFMLTVLNLTACIENDTQPPQVIQTTPKNGSTDVDPSLTKISVTFNESMKDGNWSWAYTTKNQFPEMTGQPTYSNNFTKNTLPVKLEANKTYEIWINSQTQTNFKDQAGNTAIPFKWVFKTK
ncbi:hypothetical protein BVY03_03125 [bacterium K02(2017)]|nr:hypothetical protein BVY03_03125 [bacterium K02(2017)]